MKIFFLANSHQPSEVNRREYVNNPKFFANTIELRIIICAFCIETEDTKASNNKEDDLCHGPSSGTTMSETFFAVRLIKLTQFCQKHNSLIAESEYISQSSVVLIFITLQKVFRLRGDWKIHSICSIGEPYVSIAWWSRIVLCLNAFPSFCSVSGAKAWRLTLTTSSAFDVACRYPIFTLPPWFKNMNSTQHALHGKWRDFSASAATQRF